jgi:hypothetical protein
MDRSSYVADGDADVDYHVVQRMEEVSWSGHYTYASDARTPAAAPVEKTGVREATRERASPAGTLGFGAWTLEVACGYAKFKDS